MPFLDDTQKRAVSKLQTGKVLWGGVGSGKSRTSIYYYFHKELGGDIGDGFYKPPVRMKNLYIITTAEKRNSCEWDHELVPFLLTRDIKTNRCIEYPIDIYIDSWNNIKKYQDVEDAFFIFDEQRVVGYGAWTKAFLKITKANEWILLSATPGDTYSDYLPLFIANGYFKNKTEFTNKHVVWNPHTPYPSILRYYNTDILDRYKSNLLIHMPSPHKIPKDINLIKCDYNKDDYKFVVEQRWDIFENEPLKDAAGLCRVQRKIVNGDISRLNKLDELLNKHNRIILFYNYNYEKEALLKFLEDNHPDVTVGQSNGDSHTGCPTGKKWIYLCQYNSAAEGWNCITTNVIVFYSMNYSYKIMEQASGRINRRNSPYKELIYYVFISNSSIDQHILKAIKTKKKFNEKRYVEKMNKPKQPDADDMIKIFLEKRGINNGKV